ncbi:MAG: hypothetical protein AAF541_16655 [Pseudomonadota bacterium]
MKKAFKKASFPKAFKDALLGCLYLVSGLSFSQAAWSAEPVDLSWVHLSVGLENVEVNEDYALGIGRFDLDSHTEILGWQINDRWYFGRQDGLDSGLTLVWQQSSNQVSLSKDGVRLTRRF